ncbi:hypothetical protein GW17_00034114 [Ensete ventricosum]|nr:hypothetical protein GW17_00034114 [Ensete ventricosum]
MVDLAEFGQPSARMTYLAQLGIGYDRPIASMVDLTQVRSAQDQCKSRPLLRQVQMQILYRNYTLVGDTGVTSNIPPDMAFVQGPWAYPRWILEQTLLTRVKGYVGSSRALLAVRKRQTPREETPRVVGRAQATDAREETLRRQILVNIKLKLGKVWSTRMTGYGMAGKHVEVGDRARHNDGIRPMLKVASPLVHVKQNEYVYGCRAALSKSSVTAGNKFLFCDAISRSALMEAF